MSQQRSTHHSCFFIVLSLLESHSHNRHEAIIDKYGTMSSLITTPHYKWNICGHHFLTWALFLNHSTYSKQKMYPSEAPKVSGSSRCKFCITCQSASHWRIHQPSIISCWSTISSHNLCSPQHHEQNNEYESSIFPAPLPLVKHMHPIPHQQSFLKWSS